ncbi:endonuclease/exonuclease/phosphatase family protein [uncultured Polaribacter sp.]|uniref:endonuclease/exonuclease/phosphatase family protein n=1 Tax=uncultured Polaribacter sp. TaxID=174711 RepID=UPI0026355B26|nr:endonuclease/exonuclease/phosphatase family protein [uncultured Polaribacter sp.]
MKKLSFLDKLVYLINSLFAALLLLSFVLPYVSPKNIPFLAILSLFVPILLLINIVFAIYWLVKLKKQVLLSTAVLVLGGFVATPFFKISENNSSLNSDLKIMSFNVKAFDLFSKNKTLKNNGYAFIKKQEPDIFVAQEFYKSPKRIIKNYKYKYHKLKGNYGLVIYSKYKIINEGSLDFEKTNNNAIFVDVLKDKDTIRIYNVHFESLRIKPNEENFGESNSEKLLARVGNSFKEQVKQTELFLAHEKKWKGKKIICGDFNNTAYSWMYKQLSNNKKDAFIESGKGFGKSFDYWFPMRIDFILTDKSSIINQFKTYSVDYSDHFPIMAKVNWSN